MFFKQSLIWDNTEFVASLSLNSAESTKKQYYTCKDMVNYKILEGHQYEIVENPNRDTDRNSRLYVWKYDGWNRVFTKTWNLVFHFRIHTGERPYSCSYWDKTFAQNSNLNKHLKVHSKAKRYALDVRKLLWVLKLNLRKLVLTHNYSKSTKKKVQSSRHLNQILPEFDFSET